MANRERSATRATNHEYAENAVFGIANEGLGCIGALIFGWV